jgi:PIN domain nuclease of toxin-antitoxin system
MRVLLDTHVLLWAVGVSTRLSPETHAMLRNGATQVYFSSASIWEIAIKQGLNRRDFEFHAGQIASIALETGFVELPLRWSVAASVAALPPHHRDPFDRLLVAQAIAEHLTLYTVDRRLTAYSELVQLV